MNFQVSTPQGNSGIEDIHDVPKNLHKTMHLSKEWDELLPLATSTYFKS